MRSHAPLAAFIAALALSLAATPACDLIDDAKDQLDTRASSGGDASGDTTAAPGDTTTTPPNVSVAFEVLRVRSVTVGGTQAAEGEFSWNASGAQGLRVAIEMKTDLTQPAWTTLLSDRDPQDVGSASLPLSQQYHFRASVTHPGFPDSTWLSDIVSIQ